MSDHLHGSIRPAKGYAGLQAAHNEQPTGLRILEGVVDRDSLAPASLWEPNVGRRADDVARKGRRHDTDDCEVRAVYNELLPFQRFRERQHVFSDIYASGRSERLEVSLSSGISKLSRKQSSWRSDPAPSAASTARRR